MRTLEARRVELTASTPFRAERARPVGAGRSDLRAGARELAARGTALLRDRSSRHRRRRAACCARRQSRLSRRRSMGDGRGARACTQGYVPDQPDLHEVARPAIEGVLAGGGLQPVVRGRARGRRAYAAPDTRGPAGRGVAARGRAMARAGTKKSAPGTEVAAARRAGEEKPGSRGRPRDFTSGLRHRRLRLEAGGARRRGACRHRSDALGRTLRPEPAKQPAAEPVCRNSADRRAAPAPTSVLDGPRCRRIRALPTMPSLRNARRASLAPEH